MANKIVLKKSSVASKVPTTTDLDYGELALNYTDGKLYYKTSTNTISSFNAGAGVNNGFTTISVSGQSDIIADSSSDILTLVAGSGISIATDANTDTVTFSNSSPNITTDISITHAASSVTVNSSDGADGTINAATTSIAGVMSSSDKTKLDGIASGAEVNQNAFSNIAVSGQTTVVADAKTDTLTLVAGTNVTITTDAATDSITISANDTSVDWSEIQNKPDPVITLAGDLTGSVTLTDLTSGTLTATIAANSVALGTDTTGNYVAGVTAGSYALVTGTAGEGWSPTIAVDATSANTASKVVARDASGNFSAGTITAALSGNASTATTLQTARNINGVSFNGSAGIFIPRLSMVDDRTKAPADDTTGYMTFGFTSWANNNTSPYADYLHLRSYTDSSGGLDNLLMFRKDAIGIRLWQQTYGSATAYATYKDVAFTDSSITGNAATATKLNSQGNYAATAPGNTRGPAGLNMFNVYNNGYPTAYGNVIHMSGGGAGQLLLGWSGSDGAHADNFIRSKRDNDTGAWSGWAKIFTDQNYNQYSPTLTGGGASGSWDISVTGNAATATKLATARTISLSGDATGSVSFDGSANADIAVTIAANSVALGTDTTGNYVATIAGTANQITVTGSGSETAAVTLSLPQDIATTSNVTFNNLTVSGNLTVNGTTTTVNSTTVTLDDPIITLGGDTAPTVDDSKDRGVEFRWHNGTAAKIGFFGFDDSTGKFTFIPDATNTSEVFSGTKGTIDANVEWADVLNKPDPVVTVTLTGDVTGTANATLTDLGNGTISVATTIAADSVALGTDTTGNYVASITNGSYITGGNGGSEGAALTLAVDATSANTASKVVARDASGNFSAGTITATLTGNASTATALATGRTIAMTGDVTWTSTSFDGSANVTGTATLANSGVTAGTYKSVTVDAKGRVTGGTNPTTLSGYGITDAQPLDAELTAIAGLAGTSGFLKKTAANSWALDTSTYLTGNQTVTISGDATGSGTTSIALTLASIADSGTGSFKKITVDTKGRVTGTVAVAQSDITSLLGAGSITNTMLANTAVANLSGANTGDETAATIKTKLGITTLSGSNTGDQTITLTGDVTGSGTGSFAATLANSGVTAGTYTKVTVDAKGRVTTGASLAASDIPSLDAAKITTGTFATSLIPTGISITGNAATATTATTAGSVTTANWTFSQDTDGSLVFKYGGVVKARLSADGSFAAVNVDSDPTP